MAEETAFASPPRSVTGTGAEASTPALAPVAPRDRISSVDAARGFALLGILLMNILGFALPDNAYDDPTIAGGATGVNLATWMVTYLLVEGKMRTIFSMLFGAGVVLLTSRAEQRGGEAGVADIYYRRVLWLLVFGLLHAYFLWDGDILYYYAVAGLLLYPFRHLPARRLILAGALLLAVLVPKRVMELHHIRSLHEKGAAADAAAAAGQTLSDEQREDQKAWAEKLKEIKPPASEIEKEVADHHAGYWKLFLRRQKAVSRGESIGFYRWGFFDSAGMMLLGMALLKLGAFSARLSYRRYLTMAVIGYAVGITINAYVAYRNIHTNFDPLIGPLYWADYDVERLAVALGHVGVLMIVCKAGVLRWLTSRLAAVGQMALSNYLTHTIVCTTLFNGYGFGLYGRMQRYQIYGVVLGIWVFQLIASKIWLSHFRFGPMEWVWRSVTYWKRQPMRLAPLEALPSPAPVSSA